VYEAVCTEDSRYDRDVYDASKHKYSDRVAKVASTVKLLENKNVLY
jgi:hypothetical protein